MIVSYMTEEEISKRAKAISDIAPTGNCSYFIDVVGCATQILGFKIFFADLKSITGENALGLLLSEDRVILCDSSLEPLGSNGELWDKILRFTIGHELGHYFLHKNYMNQDDPIFFHKNLPSKERNRLEIQANKFAACLIMPEYDVRIAYTTFREKFERQGVFINDFLSEHFGVSKESARYRAKDLKIPGPFSADKKYMRSFEPLPQPIKPRSLGQERKVFWT